MALDPSIAQGFRGMQLESPTNALAKVLQIQSMQQGNALARMQMGDIVEQRKMAVEQARMKAAQEQETAQAIANLPQPPSTNPQAVAIWNAARARLIPVKDALEIYNPNFGREEVKTWQDRAGANGMPEKVGFDRFANPLGAPVPQPVKLDTMDLGGSVQLRNPYQGTAGQNFAKTMTQSERDASSRGWAGIGIQRQAEARQAAKDALPEFNADAGGFVDRRAKTVTPLPGGAAAKPLTEGQAKALQFASRMESAEKTLSQLEDQGKVFSTPGSRTGLGVGAAVNLVNTEAGQKLDQAKRDFLNAVLRRESGAVIAETEFDNGDKQYFPQIGDSPAVIRQKAQNRRTAIEGIKADIPKGHMPSFDRIVNPPTAPMPKVNTSAGVPQVKFLGFE